jgi:hypothetical protein
MSDAVWQTLIGAVAAAFLAWLQYRTKVAVDKNHEDLASGLADNTKLTKVASDAAVAAKDAMLNKPNVTVEVTTPPSVVTEVQSPRLPPRAAEPRKFIDEH